jgi:AcrR family transcriptional regulator
LVTLCPVTASRPSRAALRRERERQIVDATRALFDESGRQDARIDRIARRVGINKALVYRHFVSKEELFALTTTRYLAEINALLDAIEAGTPRDRLSRGFETFAEYGIEHPAFLDCALSLVRQPDELQEQVSDGVLLRLSQAAAAWIGWLAEVLHDLRVAEPQLRANQLYLQAIGVLHLARAGAGLRQVAPGRAQPFSITPGEVRSACVELALAVADAD